MQNTGSSTTFWLAVYFIFAKKTERNTSTHPSEKKRFSCMNLSRLAFRAVQIKRLLGHCESQCSHNGLHSASICTGLWWFSYFTPNRFFFFFFLWLFYLHEGLYSVHTGGKRLGFLNTLISRQSIEESAKRCVIHFTL